MGLFSFGPYKYKTKKGKQEFYLHSKEKGKSRLYFFSKDSDGAISSLPGGYEIVENQTTGMPFLRKKIGGLLGGGVKKPKKEAGKKEEKAET
jgi:hypothetical protein